MSSTLSTSFTSTITYQERASYTWHIDGFRSKDVNPNTNFVRFNNRSEAVEFYLHLLPHGSKMFEKRDHVTVKLIFNDRYLDRLNINLKYHYRLSIVDVDQRQQLTQNGFVVWPHETVTQFNIPRAYLLDNEERLLPDDVLTIHCEVYLIYNDLLNATENSMEPNPGLAMQALQAGQTVQDNFEFLLESGKLSDAVLVVGGKEFRVHKAVLAARSPVFSAMFDHSNTKEAKESRVYIVDIEVDVFEIFVRYLYSGKIEDLLQQYASELLVPADKYQLDCLKSICEQSLIDQVDDESVCRILLLAVMHCTKQLELKCMDYISINLTHVVTTEGWTQLTKAKPDLGFQLLQHMATVHVDG